MALVLDIMGWAGMVLVLGAYALLSAKKITSDTLAYHGMNMAGALLLAVYTYSKDAIPSALLNIIWCGIGTYALYGLYTSRRKAG